MRINEAQIVECICLHYRIKDQILDQKCVSYQPRNFHITSANILVASTTRSLLTDIFAFGGLEMAKDTLMQ